MTILNLSPARMLNGRHRQGTSRLDTDQGWAASASSVVPQPLRHAIRSSPQCDVHVTLKKSNFHDLSDLPRALGIGFLVTRSVSVPATLIYPWITRLSAPSTTRASTSSSWKARSVFYRILSVALALGAVWSGAKSFHSRRTTATNWSNRASSSSTNPETTSRPRQNHWPLERFAAVPCQRGIIRQLVGRRGLGTPWYSTDRVRLGIRGTIRDQGRSSVSTVRPPVAPAANEETTAEPSSRGELRCVASAFQKQEACVDKHNGQSDAQ
jgi:hypothetical protein